MRRADLQRAKKALRGFQSRHPRDLRTFDLPWPEEVVPIGYVEMTSYRSDKDDPLTRPNHLRQSDPDGRQGVWKLFEHEHDEGVILYGAQAPRGGKGWLVSEYPRRSPRQPDLVWYLAEFERLRCQDFAGHEFELLPSKPTQIWATPATDRILLLPKDLRRATAEDVYFLAGGQLRVTPMGIEY